MSENSATVRYAVIGTGMMGREHIENLNEIPGTKVVAISDPNPDSLRWGREVSGLDPDHCYTEDTELIGRSDVDAYVVASPNHTHAQVMSRVLDTDAHVLIEKPLGISIAECDAMIQQAERRDGIVWMGLEYRYKPAIARLIEKVEEGVAGDARMVAIREHRFPFLEKVDNWNRFRENTGGTLVEKCCHFFDLMSLITGSEPVSVMASGDQSVNHLDEEYEGRVPDIMDNAYVIVDFANGARGLLDLCMFAEASKNEQELSVVGPEGKVEAFIPESVVRVGHRGTGHIIETEVVDERITYHGLHEGSSYIQHLAFLDAIQQGRPADVTLEEGRLSVAVGIAGQRSIAEGRPVTIAEVLAS